MSYKEEGRSIMLFYKTYSVWLKREFRRWFKHTANVIYHRRWFRNARPVTFIVLLRAYVYAFFPPFQKLKKNTRLCGYVGRRRKGEEEERKQEVGETKSESIAQAWEKPFAPTSFSAWHATVTREIGIYPQRKALFAYATDKSNIKQICCKRKV